MANLLKKSDDLEVMILGSLIIIIIIVIVIMLLKPSSSRNIEDQPIQFWRSQFDMNNGKLDSWIPASQLSGSPIREGYINYRPQRNQSSCGCS